MSMFSNAAKALGLGAALWLGLAAQPAFADTWTGTYAGSDHGSVSIAIDQYQAVTCTFKSATSGRTYQGSGGVTSSYGNGFFSFGCQSATSGNDISNMLTLAGNAETDGTMSGNWTITSNPIMQGNFTATLSGSGGGGGGVTSSYDGIYQITNADGSAGDYVSVQTRGSAVIATIYRSASPTRAASFALTDGGANVATLYKWGSWDLYSGTLSGNNATLTGYSQYGLCNASVSISFGQPSTIRITSKGLSDLAPAGAPVSSCSAAGATLTMQQQF